MTTTHTQGRLEVPEPYDDQCAVIVKTTGGQYAVAVSIRNPADARRLAACWNVCEGFDTELLEHIVSLGETMLSRFQARDHADEIIIADRLRFMRERDELKKLLARVRQDPEWSLMDRQLQEDIGQAIDERPAAPPPDAAITSNSVCGKPGHTCNWVDTQPSGSKCTICGETTPF